jgi:hypothetical protein
MTKVTKHNADKWDGRVPCTGPTPIVIGRLAGDMGVSGVVGRIGMDQKRQRLGMNEPVDLFAEARAAQPLVMLVSTNCRIQRCITFRD